MKQKEIVLSRLSRMTPEGSMGSISWPGGGITTATPPVKPSVRRGISKIPNFNRFW